MSATLTQRRVGDKSTKGLSAIDTYGNEFKVPDYTIKEILDKIPKPCYERRLTSSFYYVFRDIAVCLAFGYVANTYIPMVPNMALRGVLWAAYSVLLSLPYTGLWVVGHECGHHAFSDYVAVDDTVGWIIHSYLYVPYFSWKFSHGKHHKATGHLTRDMVFVPKTVEEFKKDHGVDSRVKLSELAEDTPIQTLTSLLMQQFGGWWWYLLTNVSGQKYPGHSTFAVSHYNPVSPIFEKRDFWYIVLSDIGVLAQTFVCYQWCKSFGAFHWAVNWLVPYIFTNHWLVFITYLQHTDMTLPHYDSNEWTFARGAAATIDRDFGFIGWFFFHDIIETHVLHHYVSRIPHYNARPATDGLKEAMGSHYRYSGESMWKTLWNSARACQFVEGENGVRMFRNVNGVGVAPKS
ncbi:hypothetical protein OGAPHI_002022 [Ogataea philodendri]|uniref:Fatty acid desaturase domain-containing protein n=1 Tax=Ogataea philodendri TaxID=1378263 RepID=A0A9P8T6M5_9ASCO|nr:uncharacterized protein OGAPHI_002022 [Ogataea philodendri]KAH3668268.1 hypothetical protein OGAPHI_002022 [Ogataea philodendri]